MPPRQRSGLGDDGSTVSPAFLSDVDDLAFDAAAGSAYGDGGTFFGVPMMSYQEWLDETNPTANPIYNVGQTAVTSLGLQPAINTAANAAAAAAGASNAVYNAGDALLGPAAGGSSLIETLAIAAAIIFGVIVIIDVSSGRR